MERLGICIDEEVHSLFPLDKDIADGTTLKRVKFILKVYEKWIAYKKNGCIYHVTFPYKPFGLRLESKGCNYYVHGVEQGSYAEDNGVRIGSPDRN